jgi:hypothetical protein
MNWRPFIALFAFWEGFGVWGRFEADVATGIAKGKPPISVT